MGERKISPLDEYRNFRLTSLTSREYANMLLRFVYFLKREKEDVWFLANVALSNSARCTCATIYDTTVSRSPTVVLRRFK